MFKNLILTILCLALISTYFIPLISYGQLGKEYLKIFGEEAYGPEAQKVESKTYIAETSGKIINVVLGFLGLLLVILIIYSGFLWMTAGGNEEQVTKAKKYLKNAIIGLIIIIMAYSIAHFVLTQLVQISKGK